MEQTLNLDMKYDMIIMLLKVIYGNIRLPIMFIIF